MQTEIWGKGRRKQGGRRPSGLEVGRSPGTHVAMEPVRIPVIPSICYGNQQLDLEDAGGIRNVLLGGRRLAKGSWSWAYKARHVEIADLGSL